MERFEKVALSICNLSLEVKMYLMITTLRLGPFANSFYKKPTTNFNELRQRTSNFMQIEELKEFRNQVRADDGVEKKQTEKEGVQQYRRIKEGPRGPKFPQYTPLSTN